MKNQDIVVVKPEKRGLYVPMNPEPDNLYLTGLTIKEVKLNVNLGNVTTDVLYFEEIPDEVHLLNHFKLKDEQNPQISLSLDEESPDF